MHPVARALASLVVLLAVATAAHAGSFTGTYVSDSDRMELEVDGASGGITTGELELTQDGAAVKGTLTVGRAVLALTGTATADGLHASADGLVLDAHKVDGGLEVTLDGSAPWLFKPVPPRAPLPTPSLTAAKAATGTTVASPWGWSVKLPAGWKATERNPDFYDLAHPTEALSIAAVFSLDVTDPIPAALAAAETDRGTFQAPRPATPVTLDGGAGAITEVAGVDAAGDAVRVRAVALPAAHGAIVIVGFGRADPAAITALRARVDAIARAARIAAPKTDAARAAIAGEWWTFTQFRVSNGGREETYSLCPDGRYFGAASVSAVWNTRNYDQSVDHGSLYSANRGDGRWTAVGTAKAGLIRVTTPTGWFSMRYQILAATRASLDGNGNFFRKDLGNCATE